MTLPTTLPLRRVSPLVVPVLLLITLFGWAFSSPVASSPDDNFHLPSIWCGLGDRPGLCEESGNPETRRVPASVVNAPCFAFHPEQSGACWHPDQTGLAEATWMNANGLYPRLFYATMSVFASTDVQVAVIMMRLANATLIVGLLTSLFFVLPRTLRPALLISVVGTVVPLGLFLIPSTNPSSWAYLSAAMVWISLYGSLQTAGRRQVALGGFAAVGAIMGSGARVDAAAFSVFAVVLVLVLAARRGRPPLVPVIASSVVILVSIAFYLSANQGDALTAGLPNTNPPLTGGQHLSNLVGVPSLWIGAFGEAGLGWLDTPVPAAVSVLSFGMFAALIFLGLHPISRRRATALVVAAGAAWGVPFVLLAQSHATIGTIVQPRYVLPLLTVTLGLAVVDSDIERALRGARSIVAIVALPVAASIALFFQIRRYTVGAESVAFDPGSGAEWWWVGVPSPLLLWAATSLIFAVALVELRRRLERGSSPATDAWKGRSSTRRA